MSKQYPNYQNKSYYDYIQFIKENENFLDKLKVTKPIVKDHCPESFKYMKNNGKLHKYYTYLGNFVFPKNNIDKTKFSLKFIEKEKEKLRENKIMFKKLSDVISKRSSSSKIK
jgi:dynactin complex subunit